MMILDHLHVTAVSVNMAFSFSYTKNIFCKEVYQVCCWFYFYRQENLLSCLPANTRCDQVYASINARETSVLSRSSCCPCIADRISASHWWCPLRPFQNSGVRNCSLVNEASKYCWRSILSQRTAETTNAASPNRRTYSGARPLHSKYSFQLL